MMHALFTETDGIERMSGYAAVSYSSTNENETVIETTEEALASIFEAADVDELAGAGDPIEAAIDDPLQYHDYLVLEDGSISFDGSYSREQEK